jgi:glycosyltransferase involved in cell wall biosynthesis
MDDEIRDVLRPYQDRITHLTLSPPSLPAARNLAISQSRGEIFANLDGDDLFEDHALETLVGMLIDNPSVDCVFGSARRFGGEFGAALTTQGLTTVTRPFTYGRVLTRETGVSAVVVCRRAAFDRIHGYDESVVYGEDFDFALRLLLSGATIDYTSAVTYLYRVRSDSMTAGPRVPQMKALLDVHTKHLALRNVSAAYRKLHRRVIRQLHADLEVIRAKQALIGGAYSEAALSFRSAFLLRPTLKLGMTAVASTLLPSLVGPRLADRVRVSDPGITSSV